jgi:hypothetical protein
MANGQTIGKLRLPMPPIILLKIAAKHVPGR